jgi:YHS domain-containing protein
MKTKGLMLLVAAFLTAVIVFGGCKKKEQPAAPAKETTMKDMQMQTTKTAEDTKKAATEAVASTEQTVCPVMGEKIDKNVFVEYKGKKVYFCCAECKGKFEAAPEKYLPKLPQFKN